MNKSGIHINPAHAGLLHKEVHVKAGHKLTMAELEKAKHSKNPAERKRANFAIVARSWHHGR